MRRFTRHRYLAVLMAPLLLAGCGASSPTGTAEAMLKRVKAPPGFRVVGKCELGPNTRCYRRKPFMPLDEASFDTLIAASGLKLSRKPLMWCRNLARRRPKVYVVDNCEARADLHSVEFAVFATAVKLVNGSSLRPRDLKLVRSQRGTIYEVTPVTTDADS
jgi:hypothetical protein